MRRDYFAKTEQKDKGEGAMIIMDVKVDNLYAFKNFHMNMSYPKKIVDSTIEGEFLAERKNFRYKKLNIIMGGNATGKTSFGKLIMGFANYVKDGDYKRFMKVIDDRSKRATLKIDFVAQENVLYRYDLFIESNDNEEEYDEKNVKVKIYYTDINKKDNYELCSKRLDAGECQEITYEDINTSGWHFSYPLDAYKNKPYYSIENNENYLYILGQILKTLDPSIREVIKVKEIENTYAIIMANQSVIIKDGYVSDTEVLSSGTKAGLDISYIIASLVCDKHFLYYCDELFSYVSSEVEKACLSIMIDKLTERKQLFFTTHNTDILDMQLPKHSYMFLKKDVNDVECPIKCVSASQYLKRNTDSLKRAVENDLFCTAPSLDRLFDIVNL